MMGDLRFALRMLAKTGVPASLLAVEQLNQF